MFEQRPICARLLNNETIDASGQYTESIDTRYVYYKSIWVNNTGANDVKFVLQYSANNEDWETMGGVTTVTAGNSAWTDYNDIADLNGVAPFTRISIYTDSDTTIVDLILMCK